MATVLDRNCVRVSGVVDGRPIVFVHGFGCDQAMWRFVVPDFEVDHRIVLLDLVGSGNSDLSAYDPDKYGSLRGYATDIVEICRELALTDVVLVGHSVSAMIGVLAPVIMGNPDRPELAEELTNSFCRTDPYIARQFARVTFLSDNRADLPDVTVPTLVLQCSEDVIAPEVVGRFVHACIPGSVFTQLRATGHVPHLSAPEETTAAIRAFLTG